MQRRVLAATATAAAVTLAMANPAAAAGGWALVPAGQLAQPGPLAAVFARTATDAWAVGSYPGPVRHDGRIMLAEHWSGTGWQQTPTPNVRFFDEKLLAVHASGANDAWAVGSTNQTGFATTNPIAAHWNGTGWTIVPTPATTGSSKSILTGVVDFSPTNAWAVGRSRNARALIEHWDGSAWSIVANPDPTVRSAGTLSSATLTGISALSPTDIWAVGSYGTVNGTVSSSSTLTEHYDGTSWTVVPSPSPAPVHPLNGARQVLNGVAVVSATNVWAVGNTFDTASGSFLPDRTLIEHWDGTAWSVVASPDHPAEDTLSGVAVTSANDLWAVGSYVDRGSDGTAFPIEKTAIQHWNGTSWAAAASPSSAAGDSSLAGVSVVPGAAEAWAVGPTLALHYSSHP